MRLGWYRFSAQTTGCRSRVSRKDNEGISLRDIESSCPAQIAPYLDDRGRGLLAGNEEESL
jgi:hypothetical protein